MGSDKQPLVSIICMAYNHAAFLKEAIDSVLKQTYKHIEVVLVDDASNDNSAELMEQLAGKYGFHFIANKQNLGNCISFNRGLKKSTGDYIIDLAADDILLPKRVEVGVGALEAKGAAFGVHYSDLMLIDPYGARLGTHSDQMRKLHGSSFEFPEGDIYIDLLQHYFINAPSMIMRREVLESLGGYDETLSYEDFDFWVRSARHWKYCYSPEVLIKKRILKHSLSAGQSSFGSTHDRSTFLVCKKALNLNTSKKEYDALLRRINYEQKHALVNLNLRLAIDYQKLKNECKKARL